MYDNKPSYKQYLTPTGESLPNDSYLKDAKKVKIRPLLQQQLNRLCMTKHSSFRQSTFITGMRELSLLA